MSHSLPARGKQPVRGKEGWLQPAWRKGEDAGRPGELLIVTRPSGKEGGSWGGAADPQQGEGGAGAARAEAELCCASLAECSQYIPREPAAPCYRGLRLGTQQTWVGPWRRRRLLAVVPGQQGI